MKDDRSAHGRRHTGEILLCAALTMVTSACFDATGPSGGGHIVAGVDFDELFAEPSLFEHLPIYVDWMTRVPDATEVVVEKDSTVTVGALAIRVRIVSHDVDGVRHYGAILQEDALTGSAPVVVYAHGGDDGATVEEALLFYILGGDVAADFVWVVPSFRSEPLSFGASTWTSEGPPSPWDRDVDDALSLLEVALELEPVADEESVGVLGLSRGGGVAMLMGIRDSRIDRVVEFFGPTDFFGSFVQDVVEEALGGSLRDLPGLDYLNETYIQPLGRGEVGIAKVRLELIRRSAVLFAVRLPALQLHHGSQDATVDVSQAESMIAAMAELGRTEPDFEAYLYPTGMHDPFTMEGSIDRAVGFLSELLP